MSTGLIVAVVVVSVVLVGVLVYFLAFAGGDSGLDANEELIYQGVDQGSPVYYSVRATDNTLNTFGTGYQILSGVAPEDVTSSSVVSANIDYGGGVIIPTQFEWVSGDVSRAGVTLYFNMPSARHVELNLVTMNDLSVILQEAAQIDV